MIPNILITNDKELSYFKSTGFGYVNSTNPSNNSLANQYEAIPSKSSSVLYREKGSTSKSETYSYNDMMNKAKSQQDAGSSDFNSKSNSQSCYVENESLGLKVFKM
jgi:hypothetical protein